MLFILTASSDSSRMQQRPQNRAISMDPPTPLSQLEKKAHINIRTYLRLKTQIRMPHLAHTPARCAQIHRRSPLNAESTVQATYLSYPALGACAPGMCSRARARALEGARCDSDVWREGASPAHCTGE